MNKTRPSFPQLAVLVVFALGTFGVLLYLWLAFGGPVPLQPKGYRFKVPVPEATQLAEQADVRISGVSVGKVSGVEPGPDNRTVATVQMDSGLAPVPRDTRAILRLKTVLGESYLELTPGDRSGPKVPDGGSLRAAQVGDTVELDEILSTFDARTRRSFRVWQQSNARAIAGRGRDVNTSFGTLPGFVDENTRLFATLDSQSAALQKLVANTGTVFDAISAQRGDLSGLVTSADRLFRTTAQQQRALAGLFQALPRLEQASDRALPALTSLARAAEPVVRRLQPSASASAPVFRDLRRVSPQLRGLFASLGPAIAAARRGAPAVERVLGDFPPLLDDFVPFLRNVDPLISYVGQHRREVTAFFANVTAATLPVDLTDVLPGANQPVHYLRAAQTLSPDAMAFFSRAPGSIRRNAYPAPGAAGKLATGLDTLSGGNCGAGSVAPPAAGETGSLDDLVRRFAFRTDGSADTARPGCAVQGAMPGYDTAFPRLTAEP